MPRFYVSGIIQIEVAAKDAAEAGRKAQARAVSLMKSPTLNIGIEEATAEPIVTENVPCSLHGECGCMRCHE